MANHQTIGDALDRFFNESTRPILFAGAGASIGHAPPRSPYWQLVPT